MNYKEQLETNEWQAKREEIFDRDKFRCRNCNEKRTIFLGLSKKFGIKNYQEMKELGYNIEVKEKNIKISKNQFSDKVEFVGSDSDNIVLGNLKFAQKWTESKNPFVFDTFKFICFYEDRSIDDEFPDLNVHHKYYIRGCKAWEYDNEALITLCHKCHRDVHETEDIYVYSKVGEILYKTEICERCGGSGYLPEYSYYKNGICFGCQGEGVKLNQS